MNHIVALSLSPLLLLVTASALLSPTSSVSAPAYAFAQQFTPEDLLSNQTSRDTFISLMFTYEGRFHTDGVGVDIASGMTFDGTAIHPDTLLPQLSGRHNFSAASKEALHLSLLARAVEGHPLSLTFFAQSCPSPPPCDVYQHVLSILAAKATTLSRFNAEYPGYGGFLPWYKLNTNNRSQGLAPTDDWVNRVPALDNGQMAWGLLAVSTALTLAGQVNLAQIYGELFQRMADNALRVFYDSSRGVHRDITRISDMYLPPEQVNYTAEGSGCLCDPYEGEIFVFFADLYGNWTGYPRGARESVWINRRSMLQAVNYTLPGGAAVTVQRGFWFSAHEQWKTWTLPYISTSNRVAALFWNGEVARSWNSRATCVPGLFASVTNTYPAVCDDGGYVSALGVAAVAFQNVTCKRIVTPYAASPMLADHRSRPVGLVWYAHMLNRSRMQGPYGSTESCSTGSDEIAAVHTWDSKINSLVACIEGAIDIIAERLEDDGLLSRFQGVVEREYLHAFPAAADRGELALPCV